MRAEVRPGILYRFLQLNDKALLLATDAPTRSNRGQKRGKKPNGGGNEGLQAEEEDKEQRRRETRKEAKR